MDAMMPIDMMPAQFVDKDYSYQNEILDSGNVINDRNMTIFFDLTKDDNGKPKNALKMIFYQEGKCNAFSLKRNEKEEFTTNPEIKYIVTHYTVETNFLETLSLLTNKVSSHVLIGNKGKVYQLVPDNFKAWHAGSIGAFSQKGTVLNPDQSFTKNALNDVSIGIETLNNGNTPFTEQQIESNCRYIAEKIKLYNISPNCIIGHNEWSLTGKMDPGPYWYAIRAQLARNYKQYGLEKPGVLCMSSKLEDQFTSDDFKKVNLLKTINLDDHKKISALQNKLQKFGYYIPEEEIKNPTMDISSTYRIMAVFKMMYTPQFRNDKFMKLWDQWYQNEIEFSDLNNAKEQLTEQKCDIPEELSQKIDNCFRKRGEYTKNMGASWNSKDEEVLDELLKDKLEVDK